MSVIYHDGSSIPTDPDLFDPDNEEWISQVWDDDVAVHGTIQTSTWIVPTGWTVEEDEGPVPVTAAGVEYANGTRARLTTALTEGVHLITNRVTFQDNSSLDKSRRLRVAQT